MPELCGKKGKKRRETKAKRNTLVVYYSNSGLIWQNSKSEKSRNSVSDLGKLISINSLDFLALVCQTHLSGCYSRPACVTSLLFISHRRPYPLTSDSRTVFKSAPSLLFKVILGCLCVPHTADSASFRAKKWLNDF